MQNIIRKLLFSEYEGAGVDQYCEYFDSLKSTVKKYSFLRHVEHNRKACRLAAEWLEQDFRDIQGTEVKRQGRVDNIVAWHGDFKKAKVLIGAHYDGPPGSIGADDNASALACMLEVARHTQEHNVAFAGFNCEEIGLIGSREFAREHSHFDHVIILEMVGYYSDEPGSQHMPQGLPAFDTGDFLAVVGNRHSKRLNKGLMRCARDSKLNLSVKSLVIPFGLENKLAGLQNTTRSDHAPFWDLNKSAVMLTDTAEFRNPNYHRMSDTPDTLSYRKMSEVVRLLKNFVSSLEK